jgi:hypothetical protein
MSDYGSNNSTFNDINDNDINDSENTQIYNFEDSAIGNSILGDCMYFLFSNQLFFLYYYKFLLYFL